MPKFQSLSRKLGPIFELLSLNLRGLTICQKSFKVLTILRVVFIFTLLQLSNTVRFESEMIFFRPVISFIDLFIPLKKAGSKSFFYRLFNILLLSTSLLYLGFQTYLFILIKRTKGKNSKRLFSFSSWLPNLNFYLTKVWSILFIAMIPNIAPIIDSVNIYAYPFPELSFLFQRQSKKMLQDYLYMSSDILGALTFFATIILTIYLGVLSFTGFSFQFSSVNHYVIYSTKFDFYEFCCMTLYILAYRTSNDNQTLLVIYAVLFLLSAAFLCSEFRSLSCSLQVIQKVVVSFNMFQFLCFIFLMNSKMFKFHLAAFDVISLYFLLLMAVFVKCSLIVCQGLIYRTGNVDLRVLLVNTTQIQKMSLKTFCLSQSPCFINYLTLCIGKLQAHLKHCKDTMCYCNLKNDLKSQKKSEEDFILVRKELLANIIDFLVIDRFNSEESLDSFLVAIYHLLLQSKRYFTAILLFQRKFENFSVLEYPFFSKFVKDFSEIHNASNEFSHQTSLTSNEISGMIMKEENMKRVKDLVREYSEIYLEMTHILEEEFPQVEKIIKKSFKLKHLQNKIKTCFFELKDFQYGSVLQMISEISRLSIFGLSSDLQEKLLFFEQTREAQNAFMLLSLERDFGLKLVSFSENLTRILQYTKEEMNLMIFEILLPQDIRYKHNVYVKRYYETGYRNTMGKNMTFNFLDSRKQIVPCTITKKEYMNLITNQLCFYAHILMARVEATIVCNRDSQIVSATENLIGALWENEFPKRQIFLGQYIPKLSHYLTIENQLQKISNNEDFYFYTLGVISHSYTSIVNSSNRNIIKSRTRTSLNSQIIRSKPIYFPFKYNCKVQVREPMNDDLSLISFDLTHLTQNRSSISVKNETAHLMFYRTCLFVLFLTKTMKKKKLNILNFEKAKVTIVQNSGRMIKIPQTSVSQIKDIKKDSISIDMSILKKSKDIFVKKVKIIRFIPLTLTIALGTLIMFRFGFWTFGLDYYSIYLKEGNSLLRESYNKILYLQKLTNGTNLSMNFPDQNMELSFDKSVSLNSRFGGQIYSIDETNSDLKISFFDLFVFLNSNNRSGGQSIVSENIYLSNLKILRDIIDQSNLLNIIFTQRRAIIDWTFITLIVLTLIFSVIKIILFFKTLKDFLKKFELLFMIDPQPETFASVNKILGSDYGLINEVSPELVSKTNKRFRKQKFVSSEKMGLILLQTLAILIVKIGIIIIVWLVFLSNNELIYKYQLVTLRTYRSENKILELFYVRGIKEQTLDSKIFDSNQEIEPMVEEQIDSQVFNITVPKSFLFKFNQMDGRSLYFLMYENIIQGLRAQNKFTESDKIWFQKRIQDFFKSSSIIRRRLKEALGNVVLFCPPLIFICVIAMMVLLVLEGWWILSHTEKLLQKIKSWFFLLTLFDQQMFMKKSSLRALLTRIFESTSNHSK